MAANEVKSSDHSCDPMPRDVATVMNAERGRFRRLRSANDGKSTVVDIARPTLRPPTMQVCDIDTKDRIAWEVSQAIANRQFRAVRTEDLRVRRGNALRQLPRWKRSFYKLLGLEPKVIPETPSVILSGGVSVVRDLVLPGQSHELLTEQITEPRSDSVAGEAGLRRVASRR